MGLIGAVLGLPLAPLRGVVWIAEQLREQALRELYDPDVIRAHLAEVEAARAAGTIDEEEAAAREAELVRRLMDPRSGTGTEW